jgi:hypothetical protein
MVAQTRLDLKSQSKNADLSQSGATAPVQTGATLPVHCSAGQLYFLSSNAPGRNLYGCAATDTWTPMWGNLTPGSGIAQSQSGGGFVWSADPAVLPFLGAGNLFTGNNRFGGKLSHVPGVLQTLTAASAIDSSATLAQIAAGAVVTLTSAPTIQAGDDGQHLYLVNVSDVSITLQDKTQLPGSNVCGARQTNISIGGKSAAHLTYSGAAGCWMQVGAASWSALANPTANLSLAMGHYTTSFQLDAATGGAHGLKVTDTADNTGTGILGYFTTAARSTMIPWQADAAGKGWQIDANGVLQQVGATRSGTWSLAGITSGNKVNLTVDDATAPWTLTLPTGPAQIHQWLTTDVNGAAKFTQPSFSDLSGILSPAQLPAPGLTSLGGIKAVDCSSGNAVQRINTDGTVTCAALGSGGGGGGGMSSLNGLSASVQTFSNDTNVTVTSSGMNHSLGWTGTLAKSRQNPNTLYSDGAYANPAWLTAVDWSKLTGIPSGFTPSAHASAHLSNGSDPIAPATSVVRGTVTTTTTTSQVVSTDDSRMTNARTPTAHAATHQNGGGDEVATAAPAAFGIPKAGAAGTLAPGWLPAPSASTLGGVMSRDCSAGGTNAVQRINPDGSVTCVNISGGGGGSSSSAGAPNTIASSAVDGNSYPAFLSWSGSSLGLTIVGTATPLVLNIGGSTNSLTADTTLALPASAISFVYATSNNTGTLAGTDFGYTGLPPLYSFTAPAAPGVGQHWFDLLNTAMKYWTGSGWTSANRIFLGVCDTSASGILGCAHEPFNLTPIARFQNFGDASTTGDTRIVNNIYRITTTAQTIDGQYYLAAMVGDATNAYVTHSGYTSSDNPPGMLIWSQNPILLVNSARIDASGKGPQGGSAGTGAGGGPSSTGGYASGGGGGGYGTANGGGGGGIASYGVVTSTNRYQGSSGGTSGSKAGGPGGAPARSQPFATFGAPLVPYLGNGGGAGGGDGSNSGGFAGSGGGMVYLRAPGIYIGPLASVLASGTNGGTPAAGNTGGGGGGGGGAVLIQTGAYVNAGTVAASGGAGGSAQGTGGAGGTGGSGIVKIVRVF